MEAILTKFRAMRTELDGLIKQLEKLDVKGVEPEKKAVRRPKKEKPVETADTSVEKTDKRRKPMSEEQKAKMKAGREAKKAQRDAEKAAAAAAAAAGGGDADVEFEDDEETAPVKSSDEPRRICRKCVINLKYGTDHRRCFFTGLEEGLWDGESAWTKDCVEFAKRFAEE
jgi:hypothetical protein